MSEAVAVLKTNTPRQIAADLRHPRMRISLLPFCSHFLQFRARVRPSRNLGSPPPSQF